MSEVVEHIRYLARVCMEKDGAQDIGSGRAVTSDRNGYNINLWYCNGQHPVDRPPSYYSNGWPGKLIDNETRLQLPRSAQNSPADFECASIRP